MNVKIPTQCSKGLGGHLWPSSIGLSILLMGFNLKNSVLELGSGLGLPSSFLRLKNANVVVSSDNDEDIVESINGEYLDWTNQKSYLNEKFDTIIASDVAYDMQYIPGLIKTIKYHLSENGVAVIVGPEREAMKFLEMELGGRVFEGVLRSEFVIDDEGREEGMPLPPPPPEERVEIRVCVFSEGEERLERFCEENF